MVEILCPHCDEEIELDDGVIGEFSCPHCDEDFTWDGSNSVVRIVMKISPGMDC